MAALDVHGTSTFRERITGPATPKGTLRAACQAQAQPLEGRRTCAGLFPSRGSLWHNDLEDAAQAETPRGVHGWHTPGRRARHTPTSLSKWVAQGWLTGQETCIALHDMATLTDLMYREAAGSREAQAEILGITGRLQEVLTLLQPRGAHGTILKALTPTLDAHPGMWPSMALYGLRRQRASSRGGLGARASTPRRHADGRAPAAPVPRGRRARSTTLSPTKGAMAFRDIAETRTYVMLHQALRYHTTLHTLSFPHTLGTCGALVALLCAQLDAPDDALDTEVPPLLAALKQETRVRATLPPRYAFPVAFPTPESLGHLATSEAVFTALAQLCHDSLEAERITQAGAVRIGISLLADLLAMLRHQYAHTAAEVETQIDRLRGPLQAQITAYRRRQAPD